MRAIFATILLLSTIAKSESLILKLATDSETLKRVETVYAKFVLNNGNSFTASFAPSEIAAGVLEKTLEIPFSDLHSCRFDWIHSLLKEDTPAAGPNPFNDFDKVCRIDGNVIALSPNATIQIARLQIEASAFSKRSATKVFFGVKPEPLLGQIKYASPLVQGNVARAPIIRTVSTLSYGPLKYQFQATWFKSPNGSEKETKEFDSNVIVIE